MRNEAPGHAGVGIFKRTAAASLAWTEQVRALRLR